MASAHVDLGSLLASFFVVCGEWQSMQVTAPDEGGGQTPYFTPEMADCLHGVYSL